MAVGLVTLQVIEENLQLESVLLPGSVQREALRAAKHWMAQEWPKHHKLQVLRRDGFLAPFHELRGDANNTLGLHQKRAKPGEPISPAVTDTCPSWLLPARHAAQNNSTK